MKPLFDFKRKPPIPFPSSTTPNSPSIHLVTKQVGLRARLVFKRLQRFYSIFNVLAALISGLSLATMTFDEFHPTIIPAARSAEALLCSSAMTATCCAMLSTMLMFRFESHDAATRKELAVAWLPLVLLDLAIVEFLIGLMVWYGTKAEAWRWGLVAGNLTVLLGVCVVVAVWMWRTMSVKGGLGLEEVLHGKVAVEKRGADY